MTMSWLADRKATTTAAKAVPTGSVFGSVIPSASIAAPSRNWIVSAQLRRRPSRRVRTGIGNRSISGDHRNLRLYEARTRPKRPIAVSDTPNSASQ